MKLKKGAMFGLDARIALAIFGALSVISGAALYSAIQQAKAVSFVANLEEVSKAIEAYMLDTGLDITEYGVSDYVLRDLIQKPAGVTNWKGPYISRVNNAISSVHGVFLDFPEFGGHIGLRRLNPNLGGPNYNTTGGCATKPCYYWIQAVDIDPSIIKAAEEIIDGTYDKEKGKARIIDTSDHSIFIKGPLVLKQP